MRNKVQNIDAEIRYPYVPNKWSAIPVSGIRHEELWKRLARSGGEFLVPRLFYRYESKKRNIFTKMYSAKKYHERCNL